MTTFEKFRFTVQEKWFEITIVAFFIGWSYLMWLFGSQYKNGIINAGAGACESVGMQVGLRKDSIPFLTKISTQWSIICIPKEAQP